MYNKYSNRIYNTFILDQGLSTSTQLLPLTSTQLLPFTSTQLLPTSLGENEVTCPSTNTSGTFNNTTGA